MVCSKCANRIGICPVCRTKVKSRFKCNAENYFRKEIVDDEQKERNELTLALQRLLVDEKLAGLGFGYADLFMLVREKRYDVIERALSAGCNPDATDQDDRSLIHHAVINGDFVMTSLLLRYGANAKCPGLLHMAAIGNMHDIIKILFANGADISQTDKSGNSALHFALNANRFKVARMLVRYGADINLKNKFGETPLAVVVSKGLYDFSLSLIDLGADVNAVTCYSIDALFIACYNGDINMIKLLLSRGATMDKLYPTKTLRVPLITALIRINKLSGSVVKCLANRGYDFSMKDSELLHNDLTFACEFAAPDILEMILQKIPDINDKKYTDGQGRLPIECASKTNLGMAMRYKPYT